jgi:hypothetical protein
MYADTMQNKTVCFCEYADCARIQISLQI